MCIRDRNYNEFYEARHFTRGMEEVADVRLTEELTVPIDVYKRQIQPLIFLPVAVWMGFGGEKMIAILIMLASPTTPSCYICRLYTSRMMLFQSVSKIIDR